MVNRPTTNRRLIDGRPADRPTGPTKFDSQTDRKRPGLLDVDLVDLVLSKPIRRNMTGISQVKKIVCTQTQQIFLPFHLLTYQTIIHHEQTS